MVDETTVWISDGGRNYHAYNGARSTMCGIPITRPDGTLSKGRWVLLSDVGKRGECARCAGQMGGRPRMRVGR